MSFAQTSTVTITTDASGDATGHLGPYTGKVNCIIYTKTDYDTGVDFTITSETTGQTVWTESNVDASKTVSPKQATHSNVGVASLYAAAGEPVEEDIFLVNERLVIVISNGGNAKSGAFRIVVT